MEVPDVRFATTDDGFRIAYQAWGEGPTLVLTPALVSHIEVHWESELYRRVLERLGRHMRVIQFDKRGMGLSDRFGQHQSSEQRIADFRAVMDAEGIDRAAVSGLSEGGVMAVLFSATYPERVEKLIVVNSVSPHRYWDRLERLGSPGRPEPSEVRRRWDDVVAGWSSDPAVMVDWVVPSLSGNESFLRWTARLQRMAASQDAIRRQVESVFHLDAGDAVEQVQAPTLILHSGGDRVLDVGHGRILAELIPDSRIIEIDDIDHFCLIGPNWRQFVDAYIEFVTGSPPSDLTTRRFATVLFTDIVGSTATAAAAGDHSWHEILDSHARICDRAVTSTGGRIVKSTGDGVLAMFDTPSAAVDSALSLRHDLQPVGIHIRAGIHAGEVEVHDDGDLSGLAVNLAARVEQAAPAGEIYVSSTVRDLLLGGTYEFEDTGEHELKGIDGLWTLCRLA
jgi:class 3 adenylate cyclase/pimeloyl-ACP methyl ester carboxylesterase